MADDERSLRGVGGWLAFFILVLTVFGPLGAIVQTARTLYADDGVAAFYGARWIPLQAIEWSLVALAIGARLYLGWRLYAVRTWRSVQLTIAGLWLIAPVVQLVDAIAVSLLAGVAVGATLGMIAGEIIRSGISAAVWTAYLLRSRRVANTYERHPASDELTAVFD